MTNRVPHSLGVLIGFLSDHNFFLDPSFLIDDGLLAMGCHVNRAILEGSFARPPDNWPIDRTALHCDPLLAQGHIFLHRLFDGVGMHPDVALLDGTFADLQLLLIDRDHLFLYLGRAASRGAGGRRSLGAAGVEVVGARIGRTVVAAVLREATFCRCTSHAAFPGWMPDQPVVRHCCA